MNDDQNSDHIIVTSSFKKDFSVQYYQQSWSRHNHASIDEVHVSNMQFISAPWRCLDVCIMIFVHRTTIMLTLVLFLGAVAFAFVQVGGYLMSHGVAISSCRRYVCWNWPQAQRSHVWFMGKCNDMHNKESLQKNDNIAKSTVKHGFWPVAKWNLFHSVTVVVSAVLASCDDSACRCFGRICPHRYRPFATWCDLPAHGAGKTTNKLTLGIGRLLETFFSRVFFNFDHLDNVKPYKALTWP